MDKIIPNNSLSQSEYWNLITSTLSSYEVKVISSDGKVKTRLVEDDYFLFKDVWDINDVGQIPNFIEQFSKYKGKTKRIKFSTDNHNIGLEIKFVLYHKLFSDELSLSTLFISYTTILNKLVLFLNEKHSRLSSLLDLDFEKAEKQWIWWLNNKGVKTTQTSKNIKYGEYENKTLVANFFRYVYEKLFTLTDTREEWEKDRWDIRVLNAYYGVDYNVSMTQYYIDFTSIENDVFKMHLKNILRLDYKAGGIFLGFS